MSSFFIFNFIRNERLKPGYVTSTTHLMYGNDADYNFLALVSHEEYFYIISV